MQKEVWKDVPDYDGLYQVSNLGRVKSLKFSKEKIKTQTLNSHGYYIVGFTKNSIDKTYYVHKLVAMAFLNHVPNKYTLVVDHINNIKTDNKLENLQIITQRENASKDKKNKTSKYTGVSWDSTNNKWYSIIRINGKSVNLGRYKIEYDAYLVYKNKLKEINKL
jgi:hypothetical protein